jgi:transaldolase
LLTVSPSLLEQLRSIDQEVERKLNPETQSNLPKVIPTESQFRFQLNDDEMAENKLSDGIRRFAADAIKLENQLKGLLTA